jgi:hypothetical protein
LQQRARTGCEDDDLRPSGQVQPISQNVLLGGAVRRSDAHQFTWSHQP